VVEVRTLLTSGDLPGQEILDAVDDILSEKKIRPLTDYVQVLVPEQVAYDVNLTYWISTNASATAASIQEMANQAIAEYLLWQKTKLGRDIDPSELVARVKNAGVKRVAVTSPAYQKLEKYQVACDENVNIVYGGLEDE